MSFEEKFEIKKDHNDILLRAGQTAKFIFSGKNLTMTDHHRLFFSCEDKIYAAIKNEPGTDKMYMLIDDALDSENAHRSRFCLDLSCDTAKKYPKMASIKVPWQPPRYGIYAIDEHDENWRFGIHAKADNLCIEKGGYLHLCIERWAQTENVNPLFLADEPDEIFTIEIPEGTYSYRELSKDITVYDSDTACLLVTVEGELYSGNVYLESPFLISSYGYNLLPEFDHGVLGLSEYAWLGVNLSKKEWPEFKISLNGTTFFDDETFLRCHRYSPVEIDIPAGIISGDENELLITYTSNYHETVPVAIRELYILQKEAGAFHVLSKPDCCTFEDALNILIETEKDNLQLELKSDDFDAISPLFFKNKGLNVVKLKAKKNKNGLSFSLSCNGKTETIFVPRCVMHTEDNVKCGSGDMVYIDTSSEKAVYDYLDWYVSNNVGNLFTIRPVYRWGGQRTVNPKVWELVTRICRDMGFSYVHMTDGRDLPGLAQNPASYMLEGDGYLGCQLHERDGQLYYWPTRPRTTHPTTDVFYDIALRIGRKNYDTVEKNYRKYNIGLDGDRYILRRDIDCGTDMRAAHDMSTRAICDMRKNDNPRHTGPSVMYKYFYQQGFDFTGAETMDGALEPQLAFLRGASKAYGKDKYGVHHALQWSTHPHDNPKRYNRYMLALYLSYMHGVTDINTEEGLWFFESRYAYHNRISLACAKHREKEQKLYRFIKTHSRTGRFYTNTAFVHGRYDGWNGFNSQYIWGMPQMKLGEEGASWKLMKIFYPLNHIEDYGMVKTGYIPQTYDKPFGFFSGTPRGNIDAVPIEKSDFSEYSLLCFAGYNAACCDDFDRIYEFVKKGGTLIGGWPHMSKTTSYEDMVMAKHDIIRHQLTEALCCGTPHFAADTLHGEKISVCINLNENINVLEKTDSGKPLVYSVKVGDGEIVMINCLYYPGNKTIFPVYEKMIKKYHEMIALKEQYEIICGEDVGYTTYVQKDDARHFYLTAVDWYCESEHMRKAKLRMGKEKYSINIKFGDIVKIVAKNNIAAWPESDEAEILSVTDGKVTVQGTGKTQVFVARGGKISEHTLDFTNNNAVEIKI